MWRLNAQSVVKFHNCTLTLVDHQLSSVSSSFNMSCEKVLFLNHEKRRTQSQVEDFERICERVGNVRDEAVAQGARIVHRTKQVNILACTYPGLFAHSELALNICLLIGRSWDSTEIEGCSTGCYPGNPLFELLSVPCLLNTFEKGWQWPNKIFIPMYRCPARFFSQWSTGIIWALQSCPPGWRTTSSSGFTTGRFL